MIPLDLAGLVLVASRTLGLDEDLVLGLTDLEAAELVLTQAQRTGEPSEQAAVLLVELVRRQVFGPRSAEVAVMAALQLLALNGRDVGDLGSPAALRELLAGIAAGRLGTQELSRWLGERLRPATAPRPRGVRLPAWRLKLPRKPTDPRDVADWMEGGMFERFTDRARNVVKLAQVEARGLGHSYIGTEHVLLGLLDEPEGVGARALVSLGMSMDKVRADVERIIGRGGGAPDGHIPFTPRAKKVLELALREALQLGHNYIGTEHIVLGLVREGEGVAAKILVESGANLPEVRQEVMRLLASGAADRARTEPPKERLMADIEALYEEIVRLAKEVDRLNDLLRRHGIEPDEGTSRSA